jgi:hypothetical protein
MKKPSIKAEQVTPKKEFDTVTVRTGPLGGMEFTVDDHTPVFKGSVKVKYVAPDNGPRAVVQHRQVRGKFDPARKAEDVRLAFAKLLPGTITWSKENGYSDRKSGTALQWDRQLGRFVTRKEEPKPEVVKVTETTEDGED